MVDATRALLDELMGKVRSCVCAESPVHLLVFQERLLMFLDLHGA